MKTNGRNLIQIGQIAPQVRGADMRPTGIDPTWSHTLAQPAL
jgi:hypothetical protein